MRSVDISDEGGNLRIGENVRHCGSFDIFRQVHYLAMGKISTVSNKVQFWGWQGHPSVAWEPGVLRPRGISTRKDHVNRVAFVRPLRLEWFFKAWRRTF